jgi:hypothetical protein
MTVSIFGGLCVAFCCIVVPKGDLIPDDADGIVDQEDIPILDS